MQKHDWTNPDLESRLDQTIGGENGYIQGVRLRIRKIRKIGLKPISYSLCILLAITLHC